MLFKKEVTTGSHLVMWWLTNVRGYKLVRIVRTPKQAMFGQISYKSKWWLGKKSREKTTQLPPA